tara:strand:- start:22440 stop:22619 length:180 start_codon:yes stop_codon:yes gene_type:complete
MAFLTINSFTVQMFLVNIAFVVGMGLWIMTENLSLLKVALSAFLFLVEIIIVHIFVLIH